MTQVSHFTVITALCACAFLNTPVTACAEWSSSLRPSLRSAQPMTTQSVKVVDEPERGKRGRLQTHGGATIGEIEDFLIEPERGCIAYGVLTHASQNTLDGFMILPWELMQIDPGDPTRSSFRLAEKQNLLGTAPHVSQVQWKTSAVTEWLGTVEQYWAQNGLQPCATANTERLQVIKASDVVGLDIQTDSGSTLGTIRELILDGERGMVASVIVVQKGPSIAIHRTFFALPWTRLHLNTSHHTVVVHLGAKTDL